MIRKLVVRAAVAGVARYGAGAAVRYTTDKAADRALERLPGPLEKALPPSARTAVGTALVAADGARLAGRHGRTAAQVAGRAGRVAGRAGRTAGRAGRTAGGIVSTGGVGAARGAGTAAAAGQRLRRTWAELDAEHQAAVRRSEQSYRADWLTHSGRPEEATDALVDRRPGRAETSPLPPVPDPIPAGRNRARPALPEPEVARVQRRYRPPVKPWDLPAARRGRSLR